MEIALEPTDEVEYTINLSSVDIHNNYLQSLDNFRYVYKLVLDYESQKISTFFPNTNTGDGIYYFSDINLPDFNMESLSFVEVQHSEDEKYFVNYELMAVQDTVLSYDPSDYVSRDVVVNIPSDSDYTLPIGIYQLDLGHEMYLYAYDIEPLPSGPNNSTCYTFAGDIENQYLFGTIILQDIINSRYNMRTSAVRTLDGDIQCFPGEYNEDLDYFPPHSEPLRIDAFPANALVWFLHYEGQSFLIPRILGPSFEHRRGDRYVSSCSIYNQSGASLFDGSLDLVEDVTINPGTGNYIMETINPNYLIGGVESENTVTYLFDTNFESYHPPILTKIAYLDEAGFLTTSYEQNESGTIKFVLQDWENSMDDYDQPINIESTTLHCKYYGDEDWHEVETSFLGEYPVPVSDDFAPKYGFLFSADISNWTSLDSSLVDLKIYFEDLAGNSTEWSSSPAFAVGAPASTEEPELPTSNYNLSNHPNPFTGETTISFSLTTNLPAKAEIEIYNVKGQIVDQLAITNYELGSNQVIYSADKLSSGIYFYKLVVDGEAVDTKKMILLK